MSNIKLFQQTPNFTLSLPDLEPSTSTVPSISSKLQIKNIESTKKSNLNLGTENIKSGTKKNIQKKKNKFFET